MNSFAIPRTLILSTNNSALHNKLPTELDTLDPWLSLILVMMYEHLLGEKSFWAPYYASCQSISTRSCSVRMRNCANFRGAPSWTRSGNRKPKSAVRFLFQLFVKIRQGPKSKRFEKGKVFFSFLRKRDERKYSFLWLLLHLLYLSLIVLFFF